MMNIWIWYLPRFMTYAEAMRDMRLTNQTGVFPMKLIDVADIMQSVEFKSILRPCSRPKRSW